MATAKPTPSSQRREVANEWQPVKLGDLISIVRGRSYRSSELRDNGDTALVTLKSFHRGGGYRADGLKPYVGRFTDEQVINPGEMVVSQTDITQDGDVIGRPAIVPAQPHYKHLVASLDAAIVRNTNQQRLDSKFLYYRLLAQDYTHHVKSLSTGTTVLHLSKEALPSFEFPLPPLPQQRRIAHILGALDDKIELNRGMNETLEAMARAIFQDWFVDFGPVRAKLADREPYLPPELWALFPNRLASSELGEIPEGWAVKALGDTVEILSGGTPKTSVPEYWDGDIPWYTAKDAPSLSDIFVVNSERSITQAGVDNSSTKVLPTGTTIITARGTVGRLACLGIPMAMNQTCYGIRGASGNPDYFTYWNVRNTVSDLQARTHGTIFDTITRETFKIAQTVLPLTNAAQAFESVVTPLMDRVLGNLNESGMLAAQRDALLPRLVSGELRV